MYAKDNWNRTTFTSFLTLFPSFPDVAQIRYGIFLLDYAEGAVKLHIADLLHNKWSPFWSHGMVHTSAALEE